MIDPYEALGILNTATAEEINRAYKKLCIEHHPDKNGGVQSARFNEIRDAYVLLNEPEAKKLYDDFGINKNDPEAVMRANAYAEVTALFVELLNKFEPGAIERLDILKAMTRATNTAMKEIKNKLSAIEKNEQKIKSFRAVMTKRLTKKAAGKDIFSGTLERLESEIKASRAQIEFDLSVKQMMLTVIAEYDFVAETTEETMLNMGYGSQGGVGNLASAMRFINIGNF